MQIILKWKRMADCIDDFLSEIESIAPAYDMPLFCFVAIRKPDGHHIMQARLLLLDAAPGFKPKAVFETTNILAGQVVIPPTTLRSFLADFAAGKVSVDGFDLIFDHPEQVNATVTRFHDEGTREQRRLPVLMVKGNDQISYALQPDTDWELRAALLPYDSLNELANDYRTGPVSGDGASFAVVPAPVGLVDYDSPVHATEATPTVRISRRLNPQDVSLGLRVVHNDAVIERRTIAGPAIQWEMDGTVLRGTTKLSVPDGSSIQCILRYQGKALHFGHLYDHERSTNVRRTILQAFDPNLDAIGCPSSDHLAQIGSQISGVSASSWG
ncbi:hypothetical protein LGH82_25100 [Mesorhizobium sp. PAMC28654]|uniref:hypothetical protein n=1 Tax=Mesorhizobium sp. PAMC28654 TaxID=2880934 RepID=UPI001D0BD730|nr:hypothetical protein [Mesorhizobium sp. PAMC28654]UDL88385.1 hypothetical protein LGH82_25100 [Mesorhizobium sp. PAMC28654]